MTYATKVLVSLLQQAAQLASRRPCIVQQRVPATPTCWRGQPDDDVREMDPQHMCRECRLAFHLERALSEATTLLVGEVRRG